MEQLHCEFLNWAAVIPSNLVPSKGAEGSDPRLPQSLEDWLKKRLMDLTKYPERSQSLRQVKTWEQTRSLIVVAINLCQNELCSH